LLDNVTIAPVRGSALVDVEVESFQPQLAARIANAWSEEFIQATMDRRYESTADAREFLEDRLVALRTRLEDSERQLVGYAAGNEIISLSTSQGAGGETRTERTLASANLE